MTDETIQHFLIQPNASLESSYQLILKVCFTFKPQLDNTEITNMVLLEANLPSGFRSDAETSPSLEDNELVEKIETKNEDSTVILYLNNLEANMKYCLYIEAEKITDVDNRKPVAIVMYDYYDTNRKNTVFYNIES